MTSISEGLVSIPNVLLIALGAVIYGRWKIRSGQTASGKVVILSGILLVALLCITRVVF